MCAPFQVLRLTVLKQIFGLAREEMSGYDSYYLQEHQNIVLATIMLLFGIEMHLLRALLC